MNSIRLVDAVLCLDCEHIYDEELFKNKDAKHQQISVCPNCASTSKISLYKILNR